MAEHEAYRELSALHALEALDASERQSLETHLAACAECRTALIEWRDAAGLLAHASTPTAPGDQLRAQILAAVRAETRPLKSGAASATVVQMPQPKSNLWP